MALRAIRINVRADASFQREARVGDGTGLKITWQSGFAVVCAQQTQMTQRAQLIVGNPSSVRFRAVELVRTNPEHITGIGVVASQAILPAGKNPGLSTSQAVCARDK